MLTGLPTSNRRVLWATLVVGGASLGAVVIGLARNKAIALIGGAAAVGLFGLFTSIVSMGASVATMGLDTSGVRQLAERRANPARVAETQFALWTMAWPLALAGAAVIWIACRQLSVFATGSPAYEGAVGWLSVGVAAAVVSAAQLAILQGHGRIGDLARVRLWGSLIATLIAIGAVYRHGISGIVAAVMALPVMTALAAFWFGRTLPRSSRKGLNAERLRIEWRGLAAVGGLVMLTNALAALTELSVRAVVTHHLGLESLGFYVASAAIVSVNLSLVLNAMAADYFPRLSSVADNPPAMAAVLNQQVHLALLIAAPALIAVSVAAPLVLTILYAGAFADSALVLRLLLVAGALRLGAWAVGFVMLARRSAGAYLACEIATASAIPLTWLAAPTAGLTGVGGALVLAGIISLSAYVWKAGTYGIRFEGRVLSRLAWLALVLLGLALFSEVSPRAGLVIGVAVAIGAGFNSYRRLRSAVSNEERRET